MSVPSRTRRVIGEVAASASALVILLFALVVFDDRFRDEISVAASAGSAGAGDFAGLGQQVNDFALIVALVVAQFAREHVLGHVHLVVFTAAALLLVTLLLRL